MTMGHYQGFVRIVDLRNVLRVRVSMIQQKLNTDVRSTTKGIFGYREIKRMTQKELIYNLKCFKTEARLLLLELLPFLHPNQVEKIEKLLSQYKIEDEFDLKGYHDDAQ